VKSEALAFEGIASPVFWPVVRDALGSSNPHGPPDMFRVTIKTIRYQAPCCLDEQVILDAHGTSQALSPVLRLGC